MNPLRQIYNASPIARAILSPARKLNRKLGRKNRLSKMDDFRAFVAMLCDDPVLRIDEFQGKFVVGRDSSILEKLMVYGSYELPISTLIPKLVDSNRDTIDVGANIGFYSVLFASLTKNRRVLAFEPVSEAIERLRFNLGLNNATERVLVVPKIASNAIGMVEMKVVVGQEEYSTIGSMEHPNAISSEYVAREIQCVTIDIEVEASGIDPGFMKIDAEGSEHLVLEGALNTLKTRRPIILAEISDHLLKKNGSSAQAIIDLLKDVQYVALDPFHPTTNFFARDFGDALFVPEELRLEVTKQIA